MPHHVTLDLLSTTKRDALRLLRHREDLRRRSGALAMIGAPTYDFSTGWLPHYTLGRVALLAAWPGRAEAEEGWASTLGPLVTTYAGWHLLGEVTRVRAATPWLEWMPDASGATPLSADEPALIVIQGRLRSRYLRPFLAAARRVVAQTAETSGYVAGFGVQATWDETTSVSCWRSLADARRFAFAAGHHAEAVAADRGGDWHRTECFLQIRPLASSGRIGGVQPFDLARA